MIEIKKDTIIGDILDVAPQTAPIFLSIGMHCLGCPSSRGDMYRAFSIVSPPEDFFCRAQDGVAFVRTTSWMPLNVTSSDILHQKKVAEWSRHNNQQSSS